MVALVLFALLALVAVGSQGQQFSQTVGSNFGGSNRGGSGDYQRRPNSGGNVDFGRRSNYDDNDGYGRGSDYGGIGDNQRRSYYKANSCSWDCPRVGQSNRPVNANRNRQRTRFDNQQGRQNRFDNGYPLNNGGTGTYDDYRVCDEYGNVYSSECEFWRTACKANVQRASFRRESCDGYGNNFFGRPVLGPVGSGPSLSAQSSSVGGPALVDEQIISA